MPRGSISPILGLASIAIVVILTACDAKKSGTETASATSTGVSEVKSNAVPLSSGSEDARHLYLEGRALAEQLRAHDGRQLFEQAATKDPSFAMAHYQLAVNAATAKDFFQHLKRAVALADRASEGERLMILALDAGGNAKPARALEYQEELVAKYPGDERAHFLLGGAYFGRQEYDKAIAEYRKATEINPRFSPAYNLLGYAHRAVDQFTDAEAAFKKYIELIPDDPNPVARADRDDRAAGAAFRRRPRPSRPGEPAGSPGALLDGAGLEGQG